MTRRLLTGSGMTETKRGARRWQIGGLSFSIRRTKDGRRLPAGDHARGNVMEIKRKSFASALKALKSAKISKRAKLASAFSQRRLIAYLFPGAYNSKQRPMVFMPIRSRLAGKAHNL